MNHNSFDLASGDRSEDAGIKQDVWSLLAAQMYSPLQGKIESASALSNSGINLPQMEIGKNRGNDVLNDVLNKPIDVAQMSLTELQSLSNKTADDVTAVLERQPKNQQAINHLNVLSDMKPNRHDISDFLRHRNPGDKSLNGYLTAQTSTPPGNQECYSAQITRDSEEKAMKILTKMAEEHKTISQKEFVAIVASCCHDRDETVLALANLSKNLAGLSRGHHDGNADANGVTAHGVTRLQHRSYGMKEALEVVAALQPVSSGSDKVGCFYHFYGSLAANYYLGRAGQALVKAESATHPDPQKQAANEAGINAGQRLRN